MKFNSPQQLAYIVDLVGGCFMGNENSNITGINEIHCVQEGDIVFVDHPKYYKDALSCVASVILIDKEVEVPSGKTIIVCDDPFNAFNKITKHFAPFNPAIKLQNSPSTVDASTLIQPGVFIGNNVTIGKNCIIHPNVTIYDNTIIGDNVIIHANTVIGSDAFYYKSRPTGRDKLLSCGYVLIENNVEIGAGCTIDKGATSKTQIGAFTKIDNSVHIGHDCIIGKNCLFAAQVGIAGVCKIEDNVILWGQVGVVAKVTIGANAVILGQSGVGKNLVGNITYFGSPVDEARKKMKELAALRSLPLHIKSL